MDLEKLSKIISYALRHAPSEYALVLDKEGWTNLNYLVRSISSRHAEYQNISEDTVIKMNAASKKQRHEIVNGKIRALYGHSTKERIEKKTITPPPVLYHGTPQENLSKIKSEGIKKMSRQYVHLSNNIQEAEIVAKRRNKPYVVLIIDAQSAYEKGINFYEEKNKIWLSEDIPAEFILNIKDFV